MYDRICRIQFTPPSARAGAGLSPNLENIKIYIIHRYNFVYESGLSSGERIPK